VTEIYPTFYHILTARKEVYRYLQRTPLHPYAGLSRLLEAEVWVKHENHHVTGAFKVRGGVNLAAHLTETESRAGLLTASTGNHGQSIAFAGKVTGTAVTIAVPEGANPTKVAAMRGLGAEVVFHGRDFDEAREWVMAEAETRGARFIGPTEPELIAGVGTYALEILEDLPQVEVIIVPVGAGSGACGVCLVAKTLNPAIEVIGVQAERAPAVYLAWKEGRAVPAKMETAAEGLATRVPFANTQAIMGHPRLGLDDFLLVGEEVMEGAIVHLLEHTHNLSEMAGAASLAAALQIKDRLAGKKVVLVMSGGNLALQRLRQIMKAEG
jgi:threonine dehydratase